MNSNYEHYKQNNRNDGLLKEIINILSEKENKKQLSKKEIFELFDEYEEIKEKRRKKQPPQPPPPQTRDNTPLIMAVIIAAIMIYFWMGGTL